ncbi:hypothetical protein F2P56_031565 [Juglans regia]|uniref:Disease resistance RPP13-like protein 1 isoform X1 n=3 Tax=Juglans regia TaxID=51240 RepID=A0A2I4DVV8_JUGRE|nr:putative disease resistance RPP13-like protein 1 isoform X1 [Juglans regia]XP_035541211.1 putative disease resistance RPP13-like protein 1 isoform X1 [Juglans regia]XP_035541212.1 putative disease resistance RPP13-like protein 1 isoform X1 [Juglans regia]XP_035541213.1 putative disease resistance RPP13-like protein 1 isoform X1 [Juglans regia]XP_035541214.1 putative disease resistance RPP13-like protein 1 isoform X1 [Juglans regia]XP_035541215.1 putative disease resistance RPP13-like protei
MAGALVGGAFLSALLQVLFDRMATPEIVDLLRGQKLTKNLLRKLEIALQSMNTVLEDAEEKQLTMPNVRTWLDGLKDAVYDAEDIVDDIFTKALRRELDAEFQIAANKVRNHISMSLFVNKIERKIKELLERLEFLAEQKDFIGLRAGVGGNPQERLPTTSLVEESGIFGRDDDKEEIVNLLLSGDSIGNEMCLIAIVGMGGIGKTTLAQLLYNDNRVKQHFNLDAWVCVSKEFDLHTITKTILEAVTSATCDIKDLNRLQVTLKEKLTEKKILLVLDEVWNMNYSDWEILMNPFKFVAQGSRVIVTTRDDSVASVMRANVTHYVKKLSEEDCWSIFSKHAFHDGNFDAYPELEALGRQIVKKCESLPLAAKAIGALLRSKLDADEWDKVLKSELWDLPVEATSILPALILSYKYLPSHLKRCFVYCSIFPKGYIFDKNQLILLWMAEGFLQQPRIKTMEEIGDDYFMALVSRSLFQQYSGDKSRFVMHDLVSDLTKYVSGQFISREEPEEVSRETVYKTRHMSYFISKFDSPEKFKVFYKAKRLRTFLQLNFSRGGDSYLTKKVPHDLLGMLRYLRVLSLSYYININELPDSIGKVKTLRYLNISFTGIRRLPDSICKLCNLQTLNLSGCKDLVVLPRDMWKLINLRHLDITGTCIMEMPMQIGRLKCLQTLTKFVINKYNGSSIGELGKLINLRGNLSILELQNVKSHVDALDACLKDRKYIEELVLEWNPNGINISKDQRTVLDSLQPHRNLKSISINYYGGQNFPDWVGHNSFSNMTSLCLYMCNNCCTLPSLGQLPSLRDLSIIGLDEVVTVGPEFYCIGSCSTKSFGALEFLRFEKMLNWEIWFPFGVENEGGAFPYLKELYIDKCPKLTERLPIHLPSLAKLVIHECPQLMASLPKVSALCELELIDCNEALIKELSIPLTGMQKLTVEGFSALESLPEGMTNFGSCLHDLRIWRCSSLMSLPKGYLPPTLKALWISHCKSLELPMHLDYSSLEKLWLHGCDSLSSFPLNLFPKLYNITFWECNNLESLTVLEPHEHDLMTLRMGISDCPSFVSFPKGGLRAPNLTSFWVDNCKSLRSLPDKMHELLPSLQYLYIEDCPEVVSFPEGGLPLSLISIYIRGCDKLVTSRMGWGLKKLHSLRLLEISGKSEDVESFPEEELLPTTLPYLYISKFQNLRSLDKKGLQHLTSIKQLWICDCPKLKCMPEEGLPASLSILEVYHCPLLKKQWQKRKGKEWRKIAHVPCKLLDRELIN